MKKILKRAALVLSSTLAVLVLFAVSVLIILNFGPSPTAHKVFIKSCMETSANFLMMELQENLRK